MEKRKGESQQVSFTVLGNYYESDRQKKFLEIPESSINTVSSSAILEKGIAFFGVWALYLTTASQINQLLRDYLGYKTTNELWGLNNSLDNGYAPFLTYYTAMGVFVPLLIGGWTGLKFNFNENKGIFQFDNLRKIPKHVAASVIIFFTTVTEGLILFSCIEDFFPESCPRPTWQLVIASFFSIIGAIQYVALEGKEFIKIMSKGNQEKDEWYKNFLSQQPRFRTCIRYGIACISYVVPALVALLGYFAFAFTENKEIIKEAALNYTNGKRHEAGNLAKVIAAPLAVMYIGMYSSLYAYRAQKALRNIIGSFIASKFSLSGEPNLEEIWRKYWKIFKKKITIAPDRPLEASNNILIKIYIALENSYFWLR